MKKSSFLEGAFIATFCIIFTKVIGILYVIPFYSIIGEQGGALYGYSYTIYNFFLSISTVGFPLAISKLTSEYNTLGLNNEKIRLYNISKKFILIFSFICFLICFAFSKSIASLIVGNITNGNSISDVSFTIKMVSFALLVVPLLSILRGYLQGHKYIKEPSLSQIIEQIVRVLIIIAGSYLGLKVFNLSLKTTIGICVFASFIGAISAYLYLFCVSKKNKDVLMNSDSSEIKISNKEIFKKLILYSLPFIIISCSNHLYNSTDMVLILRTLPKLNYTGPEVESISSIFTTWAPKINSIVLAVSTGLITSLIPHIVSLYVAKDNDGVNKLFNKCISIILIIIIPLAVLLSINSFSVWTIFYGENKYGYLIIRCFLLLTITDSFYIVLNSLLQSLSKYKVLFVSVVSGIVINLVLDIPLMNLFNKLNIEAFYGAILATLIGTIVTLIISFLYLKNTLKFKFKENIKLIPITFINVIFIIVLYLVLGIFLNFKSLSRITQIINMSIFGILFIIVYLVINKKYLKELLPNKLTKIIYRK